MTGGFTHDLRIDQIRDGQRIDLVADGAERQAIAHRLDLQALDRLEAHATLTREGETVRAQGRLAASVTQRCVITGEPVAEHVDEPFALTFQREPKDFGPDEEIELAGNELDTIFYDGGEIDLGSAIADTLALSLEPFPRSAGAEAALKEAGVMSEEQAGPFAVLAQLKGSSDS